MVNLKDLFSMLASGEFSNIALSRNATGGINESEYGKVINHINLGIVEIYKRFRLLENELLLYVYPNVTTYQLRQERVGSLAKIGESRYVLLPADQEGFLNIVEVLSVYDADGNNLIMNNRHVTPAVRQLAPDVLKITGVTEAQVLSVVYQAYPSKIQLDDTFIPDDLNIPISDTIVEALLYYVASRVYKPTGANNSTANADKSIGYQQQYELALQKFALYGLDLQDNDKENNFESNGWA